MSLKAELERWVKGLEAFDKQDYDQALAHFEAIADSSKILFNMALVHATMADHKSAVAYFAQAHTLDQYFAVSFFQCGVSHFLLGQFSLAAEHFQNAYYHMRENQIIDYEQIGLKFRLYTAEILFNQALAYINMNQQSQGMQLLDQARKEKQTDEHTVIDEAYANYGRGYTVFSVPVGILFRPSEMKIKNMKAKNYLGSAKLVAATEAVDAFVGFSGLGGRPSPSTAPASVAKPSSSTSAPDALPVRSRSPPTAPLPAPPAVVKGGYPASNEVVPPLRIASRKSSVDLRGVARQASSGNPTQPGVFPGAPGLPRINTDVPRPSLDPRAREYGQPTLYNHIPVPPTPPDSEPGKASGKDLRASSGTVLGYLGSPAQATGRKVGSRDTEVLEELVDGYSGIEEEIGLPALNGKAPVPQGQSTERVADWANKQSKATPAPVQRYLDPADGASRGVTLRRYDTMRSVGSQSMRPKRRGAASEDFTKSPSAGSREPLDDIFSARSGPEMVSFRLKLHFEDDIRGMSLDADTPWTIFYARLQTKFGVADMSLKYKDEDGTFVTIADEDDWDSAIDAAREHCRPGRQDGKLDIWVIEGGNDR